MTVFTEGRHAAEFLMSEQGITFSRDGITIAAGAGVIEPGTVLGKISIGAAVAAAKAGGNTGDGTVSAVTVAAGAKDGVYKVDFTAATKFDVIDPDGFKLKGGVTGTAYADDLGFTITAGATPFIAGDGFDITVAAGSGEYVPSPDVVTTGLEGAEVASAIAIYGGDATLAAIKVAGLTRNAEVNGKLLAYDSTVDSDAKKAAKAVQLAAVGIIVR